MVFSARFLYGVLLCFSLPLSAQELTTDIIEKDAIQYVNQKHVGRLAPFISLGSYELVSKEENGMNPTQRFGFGVMTTAYSRSFNIEAGLSYLPLGAREEGRSAIGLKKTRLIDLEYVAAPVFLKKYFHSSQTGQYLKGGLMPAYLINGDNEEDFKEYDVQAVLGLGAAFLIDYTSRVFLDVSWGRSLRPVSKNDSEKVYNQGFLVSAGVTL